MEFHKIATPVVLFGLLAGGTFLFSRGCSSQPSADKVGQVSTSFNLLGSHKIVVEAVKDPKIEGVVIHISAARTGGLSGTLGLAEDTSDASIDAAQNGPIRVLAPLPQSEEIFSEKRSLLFKHLHVTRFWDEQNKTFVYLAHSDKLINGSPKNSVSTVAPATWDGQVPDLKAWEKPQPAAPRP